MKPSKTLFFAKGALPKTASPACLKVTERYRCEEGEGSTLGASTFLIRLSGCNLRCSWCDSKQASFFDDEERMLPVQALLEEALQSEAAWISITGGEPTWRSEEELRELAWLCKELLKAGRKTKIESNGLLFPEALSEAFTLWSVAPKWDARKPFAQHRQEAMDYNPEILKGLLKRFAPHALQLKWVISSQSDGSPKEEDLMRSLAILQEIQEAGRAPLFFIPEAYGPGEYLERCKKLAQALQAMATSLKDWDWRVQPQWHRVLYGDARGR